MSSHNWSLLGFVAGVALGVVGAGLTLTGYQSPSLGWLLVAVGGVSAVIMFSRIQDKPLQLTVLSEPHGEDDSWYVNTLDQGNAGNPRWTFCLMLRMRLSNPHAHPVELDSISVEVQRRRRLRRRLPLRCFEKKVDKDGGGLLDLPAPVPGGGHLDLYLDFSCDLASRLRLSSRLHRVRIRAHTPAGVASAFLLSDFLPGGAD